MTRLAIAGAAGRMGCELVRAAGGSEDVKVTAAIEREGHPALGEDAGVVAGCGGADGIGIPLRADADGADFDLMVEFTTPESTLAHVEICRELHRGMVIGTTGLDAAAEERIRRAARDIPIVLAANTSVGVTLCAALAETAAKVLGAEFDIEIVEAHHRHKVDAPSGTALLLGRAAAAARGKDIETDGVFARHGHTGAREAGAIGFSTIRGGDIAGEHNVLFIGEGERVEITHRANHRKIFAEGALKAARWLARQSPGLYDMRDVLGLDGGG